MDTNIEHLIETINKEIANLETDFDIYENRIKELEEENKKLQEENRKNAEQIAKNAVESNDKRVKAAYKDGYGTAVAKMSACLQEIKFDSVVTMKQDSVLQKAFIEDYGRYYFKVFGNATTKNRMIIIKSLKDIYNAPFAEIKSYVSSLSVNGLGCTILLENVSEATCKKLKEFLEKAQIECNYYYNGYKY